MSGKKNTPTADPAAAWRNRIVGEGTVPAVDLVPHPQNWRGHPASQGTVLAQTLGGVGWVQRVIVNQRTGRMLDGHLRAELARKQGEQTPVPVVYVDLSEDEERTILATLDPIAGMAIANEETLAGLVRSIEDADLRSVAGTIAQTLNVDVDGKGEAGKDTPAQVDRAEELRQKWGVEPGQLWQLGEHRLICGDCTDAAVVARVMGGERAALCFTDPPYGVNVTGAGGSAIAGDISFTAIPLMFNRFRDVMAPKAWLYICGGQSNMLLYSKLIEEYCRQLPRIIVWDKGRTAVMRHNGYHSCFEFIYYTFMEGGGGTWYGERDSDSADDIWRVRAPNEANGRMHVTEKPVLLPERAIQNSSRPGDIVWEPFGGSGSTLIACENLGRRCRAVEIAPGYVAVALERWATMTGKTPVLLDGAP